VEPIFKILNCLEPMLGKYNPSGLIVCSSSFPLLPHFSAYQYISFHFPLAVEASVPCRPNVKLSAEGGTFCRSSPMIALMQRIAGLEYEMWKASATSCA